MKPEAAHGLHPDSESSSNQRFAATKELQNPALEKHTHPDHGAALLGSLISEFQLRADALPAKVERGFRAKLPGSRQPHRLLVRGSRDSRLSLRLAVRFKMGETITRRQSQLSKSLLEPGNSAIGSGISGKETARILRHLEVATDAKAGTSPKRGLDAVVHKMSL